MRRFLKVALVATVAVGAGLVTQASNKLTDGLFVIRSGACVTAQNLQPNCSPTNLGPQCTAEAIIDGNSYPAYRTRANVSPFACSAPYKRLAP